MVFELDLGLRKGLMVNDQEKLKERILESMMAQREKRIFFFLS